MLKVEFRDGKIKIAGYPGEAIRFEGKAQVGHTFLSLELSPEAQQKLCDELLLSLGRSKVVPIGQAG